MFKRIYLIRKRALGDVLWAEPLLRALASSGRKIVFYTKYPELFEHHPCPNLKVCRELTVFEKIYCRFMSALGITSRVIDLDWSYEKKPRQHILKSYMEAAGLPFQETYPKLYHSKEEETLFPEREGKTIVLHLESMTDRNYRKVFGVNWTEIVKGLGQQGYKIVLIGKSPEPIPGAEVLKTSIREMIALIRKCTLFIGIDSGPSHIAAALGKPALLFFGAVNPAYRHFSDLFNGVIMQQPCEYSGCYHESISLQGPECRIAGKDGIPPCSLHTTESVSRQLNQLLTNIPAHVQ